MLNFHEREVQGCVNAKSVLYCLHATYYALALTLKVTKMLKIYFYEIKMKIICILLTEK